LKGQLSPAFCMLLTTLLAMASVCAGGDPSELELIIRPGL
jgi:hypothetical protein